jgi:3,4-dihydroxy 2-butanone 4-phosphate synthase/GTP cyclohydrolase II
VRSYSRKGNRSDQGGSAMNTVSYFAEATIPTVDHGVFRVYGFKDESGNEHLAWVAGDVPAEGALVRIQSECLTGEAFSSAKCDCGPQLDAALDLIQESSGVVLYLRGHEGRGIGLLNKLQAYHLQQDGLDTVDANLALNLPADARDYSPAVGMLHYLGVKSVRLLSNNTDKVAQLHRYGVPVVERLPLIVGVGTFNRKYLKIKRERMGHIIPEGALQ